MPISRRESTDIMSASLEIRHSAPWKFATAHRGNSPERAVEIRHSAPLAWTGHASLIRFDMALREKERLTPVKDMGKSATALDLRHPLSAIFGVDSCAITRQAASQATLIRNDCFDPQ